MAARFAVVEPLYPVLHPIDPFDAAVDAPFAPEGCATVRMAWSRACALG
jgi:hypothetical protein